jgi:hypothetical protein
MKKLDKNRPFGLVYGHDNAKYYQDGVHFTGDGRFIGKDCNAEPQGSGEIIEKEISPDNIRPRETMDFGNEIDPVALGKIMELPTEKVLDAAINLYNQLNRGPNPPPFEPVVAMTDEAKLTNARFLARYADAGL